MSNHYRIPPWELNDVPEDELYREAELLDIERELSGREPALAPGRHEIQTKRGKRIVERITGSS